MEEATLGTDTVGQDAQYGFSIIKQADGNVVIKKVDGAPAAGVEELYTACDIICRNIRANEIGAQVAQQIMQASESIFDSAQKSGLVVPTHSKKKH
jgi:hypothetical protein